MQFIHLQWTELATNQPRRARLRLPVTIGRAPESDLVLSDPQVSRKHALIDQDHGQIVLTDLQSSNGTRLDGQTVRRAPLGDGAAIQLGSTTLKIFIERLTQRVRPTTTPVAPPDTYDRTVALAPSDDISGAPLPNDFGPMSGAMPPDVGASPARTSDRGSPSLDGDTKPIAVLGKGRITHLAWSPGGGTLAVASTLGIELYDAHSLAPQQFIASPQPVERIVFAHAETNLVSITERTVDRVFTDRSPGATAILRQPHIVANLVLSPGGDAVALDLGDEVQVLSVSEAAPLCSLPIDTSGPGGCLAFAPDGQLLAAVVPGAIQVWRIADAALIYNQAADTDGVAGIAFAPDSRVLAIARNRIITIWDVQRHAALRTIAGITSGLGHVVFAPDGRTIAATDGADIRLWRVDDGTLLRSVKGPGGSPIGLAFSPDSQILAAATCEAVQIVRVRDGKLVCTLSGYMGQVDDIVFALDGQRLTAHSETIRSWRLSDGVQIVDRGREASAIGAGEPGIRTGSNAVAYGCLERELIADDALEIAEHANSPMLAFHISPERLADVYDIAVAHDADMLAALAPEKVDLFRLSDGVPLATIPIGVLANGVALSPDGQVLAIAAEEAIQIWHVSDRQNLYALDAGAHRLIFSPNGLAFASIKDASVQVWSVLDGMLLATLLGHVGAITCAAFAPRERVLASGSEDGTVRLWGW